MVLIRIVLIGIDVHAVVFVVLFELAKGWLTASAFDSDGRHDQAGGYAAETGR